MCVCARVPVPAHGGARGGTADTHHYETPLHNVPHGAGTSSALQVCTYLGWLDWLWGRGRGELHQDVCVLGTWWEDVDCK